MYELESEGYLSIDTSKSTHAIRLGSVNVSDTLLSKNELEIASDVLEHFAHKSPMDLETLATMDYIANFISPQNAGDKSIIHEFKSIKGTKFNEKTITHTLMELKDLGLVRSK